MTQLSHDEFKEGEDGVALHGCSVQSSGSLELLKHNGERFRSFNASLYTVWVFTEDERTEFGFPNFGKWVGDNEAYVEMEASFLAKKDEQIKADKTMSTSMGYRGTYSPLQPPQPPQPPPTPAPTPSRPDTPKVFLA